MMKLRQVSSAHLLFASLLCLIFIQTWASSSSLPTTADPLPLLSLKTNPNQAASRCTYRVQITTSCSSKKHTRDKISISFGDAYGNQVYVERIDNPASHAFEACSTDTFDLYGPCTHNVCYVYLYRKGTDGLTVASVKISGQSTKPVTFKYNKAIPNGVWFGFNYCNGASTAP